MEADISNLRKTGHFYFALTAQGTAGRAYLHRILLATLKCISAKRWEELAARRRGEEPGGPLRLESGRHGHPRSLFRSGP